MADLGETSQAGTAHKHAMSSWVTVLLIVVAAVVLGFAFVLQSIPLAIVGVVFGIAGIVCGAVYGILDDAV